MVNRIPYLVSSNRKEPPKRLKEDHFSREEDLSEPNPTRIKLSEDGARLFKSIEDAQIILLDPEILEAESPRKEDLLKECVDFNRFLSFNDDDENILILVNFAIKKELEERAQLDLQTTNPPEATLSSNNQSKEDTARINIEDFLENGNKLTQKATEQGWRQDEASNVHFENENTYFRSSINLETGNIQFTLLTSLEGVKLEAIDAFATTLKYANSRKSFFIDANEKTKLDVLNSIIELSKYDNGQYKNVAQNFFHGFFRENIENIRKMDNGKVKSAEGEAFLHFLENTENLAQVKDNPDARGILAGYKKHIQEILKNEQRVHAAAKDGEQHATFSSQPVTPVQANTTLPSTPEASQNQTQTTKGKKGPGTR